MILDNTIPVVVRLWYDYNAKQHINLMGNSVHNSINLSQKRENKEGPDASDPPKCAPKRHTAIPDSIIR